MAEPAESRLPLTRDRILRAALALADEGGIDALSMRKLGQSLGYEAMSLYNHVANKDDVVDGILDLVLAESEPPSPAEDWRPALRRSAVTVYRALIGHPWAAPLLMSPARVRPARLRYMDTLLGRLRAAGFSPDTTYHAYHVLDAWIFGFAVWHASHTFTDEQAARLAETVAKEIETEYPHLYEHAQQHFADGPHREVSGFEFGLDLVLDGLEKLR